MNAALVRPALLLCAVTAAFVVADAAEDSPGNALLVDAGEPRLAANPKLVARIAATPHAYFRFVNAAFASEACRRFGDDALTLPEANLHGDAHVEQYTVTSVGRGLSDFDDCTRGKPIIDLLRFGTSLVLAARQKGWQRDADGFVGRFLEGYRDALRKRRLEMRTPALVTRTRARFRWEHAPALGRAHALIDAAPLPTAAFAEGIARFAELVGFARELPPHFFEPKRIGALSMGIGSALDEKYLIIFEGETRASEDDLIVEAKQIRDLSGNPCVRTDVSASRVLDGQRLIAYEPFAYAAVVSQGGKHFWVHDWTDEYFEASIADDIERPRDLRALAYDSGVQLGRAHPKRADGSVDEERRQATLAAADRLEPRIRALCRELADETEAAWRRFRNATRR